MTVALLYHSSGSSISYQAWNSIIECFEIDTWEEIGNRYKNINSFMSKHKFVYVMLVPEDSIPKGIKPIELKHFIHPTQDVCYIFGDEKDGISNKIIKDADFIVTIKCKNELLSYITAAITFYDRKTKLEKK